jgi:hypothetical protein
MVLTQQPEERSRNASHQQRHKEGRRLDQVETIQLFK